MLAIFATLSEALCLARSYWALIFVIVIVELVLNETLSAVSASFDYRHHPITFGLVVTPILLLVQNLILSAKSALLLGALGHPQAPSRAGLEALRRCLGTLFWLRVLITFIMVGCLILPLLAAIQVAGAAGFHEPLPGLLPAIFSIFYLICVKYALADPLVVRDGMKATTALHRSWQMTKGNFFYVLGCILCLAAISYFSRAVSSHFENNGLTFVAPFEAAIQNLIGSLSILVAWCMYVRINLNHQAAPFAA